MLKLCSFSGLVPGATQEKLRLEQRAALVRSIQMGDVTAVLAVLEKVDEPLTNLGWPPIVSVDKVNSVNSIYLP